MLINQFFAFKSLTSLSSLLNHFSVCIGEKASYSNNNFDASKRRRLIAKYNTVLFLSKYVSYSKLTLAPLFSASFIKLRLLQHIRAATSSLET